MTEPIYKVFMGRPLEAWDQLSATEQTQLLGRLDEKLTEVGGKHVIVCKSH